MDTVTIVTRFEIHKVGFNLGFCLGNEYKQVIK